MKIRASIILVFLMLVLAASTFATSITVGSTSFNNWQKGGTTATLRIYASGTFRTSTGSTIPAGSPNTNVLYQSIACTVVGTSIGIPSFILDSTADGLPNDVHYSAWLYDSKGAKVAPFMVDFAVPAFPVSTTWDALQLYNGTKPARVDTTYYTSIQTNQLLTTLATTLTPSTLAATYGNSLASAVSSIGGANKDLIIDANTTVSSDLSIPSNVRLNLTNGAQITVATGKTLTVGSINDPGNVKIFSLSGTGAVRLAKGGVDICRTAWFTGPADSVDITAALTQCSASVSSNKSGIIQVPAGNWLTTGNITLPIGSTLRGTSAFSTGGTFGTVIKMSAIGTYVFKIPGTTAGVHVEDITIDGDSKATDGILLEDAYPNTTYDTVLRHISVTNCVEGVYVHATDGVWQNELLTIEQSMFVNNSHAGLRYSTVNGSLIVKDANFQVPDNGFGLYIDNAASVALYNPQFAGLAGSLGYSAGEPNAGMAEGAIRIVGQVNTFAVHNSQDEGFRDFIRHTNTLGFAGGAIDLYDCTVESLIRLEGQVNLKIRGGKYFRHTIRDNASGSSNIDADGYSLFTTGPDLGAATDTLYETFTGNTMRQRDFDHEHFTLLTEVPDILFKPTSMGSHPTTSPFFGVFADNAYTDQCLIGFGASTAIGTILSGNRFCIGRTTSNGHAFFTGTQVGRQYDFDAQVNATKFGVASSATTDLATFSGTGGSTRISINSTTGSPNAGLFLQANGSDIWQLVNYGGNRFSVFNVGLANDAFTLGVADNHATFAGDVTAPSVGATGAITANSAAITTTASVADDPYAASWNGSTNVPTKNAVYDKIEAFNGWANVFKAGDTTRTANTTLTADPDLTFSMLASKNYVVEIELFFDTTAPADFKFSITGPASPTLVRVQRQHIIPGTTAFVTAVDVAYTGSTSIIGTGTTGGWLKITMTIQNGVNAGAVNLNWAQDTSDAGNTIVRAGSFLRYRQVN